MRLQGRARRCCRSATASPVPASHWRPTHAATICLSYVTPSVAAFLAALQAKKLSISYLARKEFQVLKACAAYVLCCRRGADSQLPGPRGVCACGARQAVLQERYGFACGCARCQLESQAPRQLQQQLLDTYRQVMQVRGCCKGKVFMLQHVSRAGLAAVSCEWVWWLTRG